MFNPPVQASSSMFFSHIIYSPLPLHNHTYLSSPLTTHGFTFFTSDFQSAHCGVFIMYPQIALKFDCCHFSQLWSIFFQLFYLWNCQPPIRVDMQALEYQLSISRMEISPPIYFSPPMYITRQIPSMGKCNTCEKGNRFLHPPQVDRSQFDSIVLITLLNKSSVPCIGGTGDISPLWVFH